LTWDFGVCGLKLKSLIALPELRLLDLKTLQELSGEESSKQEEDEDDEVDDEVEFEIEWEIEVIEVEEE